MSFCATLINQGKFHAGVHLPSPAPATDVNHAFQNQRNATLRIKRVTGTSTVTWLIRSKVMRMVPTRLASGGKSAHHFPAVHGMISPPRLSEDSSNYDTPSKSATAFRAASSYQPSRSNFLSRFGGIGDWVWEAIAVLVAAVLLTAQFILLRVFDGRHSLEWAAPIGLNTLVAILSTVARIYLASAASNIVAQMQWSLLQRKASVPLHDLEVLNQASRGAWASVKLLISPTTMTPRQPNLLVALIVILVSIAMGPFAQQAVRTRECQVWDKSQVARIPNIQTLGNIAQKSEKRVTDPSLDVKIKAGLITSLMDTTQLPIIPTCVSGNCTFPAVQDIDGSVFTHRSVGFCSRCLDISQCITSNIEEFPPSGPVLTGGVLTWQLPNTHRVYLVTNDFGGENRITQVRNAAYLNISSFIHGADYAANWTWRQGVPGAGDFLNATRNALVEVDFISIDDFYHVHNDSYFDLAKLNVSATTCALYPCLKTYNSTIVRGNLSESLVSSEPLRSYSRRRDNILSPLSEERYTVVPDASMVAVRTPCVVSGKIYTSENIRQAPGAITLTFWDYDNFPVKGDAGFPIKVKSGFGYEVIKESEPELDRQYNQTRKIEITAPPECLYAVDVESWYPTARGHLERALSGNCLTNMPTEFEPSTSQKGNRLCVSNSNVHWKNPSAAATLAADPYWLEPLGLLKRRSHIELGEYFEQVAESVTRLFRTTEILGRQNEGNEWRANAEAEAVMGQVWQTSLCFEMNVAWLALPAVMTFLTLLALLWTMVFYGASTGEVVWRSSILPFVYYREKLVVVRQGDGSATIPLPEREPLLTEREMEKDSKLVRVRLSLDH